MRGPDLPIRKAALNACVTTALGVVTPLWSLTRSMMATSLDGVGLKLLVALAFVLACLAGATFPVFCFALYRNEGKLHIPKPLRSLSLVVAVVFGAITPGSLEWIEGLGQSSTVTHLMDLFATLSNLAYILLLLSFFRHRNDDGNNDVPISSFLRVVTKVAAIVLGIVAALALLRLAAVPFVYYSDLRPEASRLGLAAPALSKLMKEVIFTALTQACSFAGPYVVYKSLRPQ